MREMIEAASDLRVMARKVLSLMECPHLSSEYGNCSDCLNHGYIVTCDQEMDLVTACQMILRATEELIGDDHA